MRARVAACRALLEAEDIDVAALEVSTEADLQEVGVSAADAAALVEHADRLRRLAAVMAGGGGKITSKKLALAPGSDAAALPSSLAGLGLGSGSGGGAVGGDFRNDAFDVRPPAAALAAAAEGADAREFLADLAAAEEQKKRTGQGGRSAPREILSAAEAAAAAAWEAQKRGAQALATRMHEDVTTLMELAPRELTGSTSPLGRSELGHSVDRSLTSVARTFGAQDS